MVFDIFNIKNFKRPPFLKHIKQSPGFGRLIKGHIKHLYTKFGLDF